MTTRTPTRDERAARIADLKAWFKSQEAEFANKAFPREVREAWDANTRELEEHEAVFAELSRRDDRVEQLVRSGRFSREDGATFPDRSLPRVAAGASDDPRVRAQLDGALGAIERHVDSGHLTARAADRLDRLVRQNDLLGLGSRYLSAVAERAYLSAFGKLLMYGPTASMRMDREEIDAVQRVTRVEQERAMVEGTGNFGGFAVPFQLDPTVLISSNGAINPIRELATVIEISAFQWRGVAGSVTASYGPEGAEAADSSPTLTQPTITPARGDCFVPVSIELTQDWVGLQQQLAKLISDAKDVADATQFLTGTGVNSPTGILAIGSTGALTTAQRTLSAGAGALAIGDIYAVKENVPARWQTSMEWFLSPTLLDKVFRLVASASTTEPQPMPMGRGGPLVGKNTHEWSTMATAVATGNRVALVGDPTNFTIVDRIGMNIEVIPHLFGPVNRYPTGQRGVFAFWRTGSAVTIPAAFQYLEIQ